MDERNAPRNAAQDAPAPQPPQGASPGCGGAAEHAPYNDYRPYTPPHQAAGQDQRPDVGFAGQPGQPGQPEQPSFPQQPADARQPYGAPSGAGSQPYGTAQQPSGAGPQPYGAAWGAPGTPQGFQPLQYGQPPYGAQPYGAPGNAAQQPYGQPQQPYGAPYGAPQQPYAPQSQGQQPFTQQPYAQQPYAPPSYSQPVATKDHVAAGLLAIFLGVFGVHKFYLGYNTAGFVMLAVTILGSLLTLGLAATVIWIISIIEGVIYLAKSQSEFDAIYVARKKEWF